MKPFLFLIVSLLLAEQVAFAESKPAKKQSKKLWRPDHPLALVNQNSANNSAAVLQAPAPSQGKLIGYAEFRPTWEMGDRKWTGEHLVELGYSFNPKFSLTYDQQIASTMTPSQDGQYFSLADGFIRANFKNIHSSPQSGVSLSFEPRIYLPTAADKRDKGMITTIRNIFRIERKISDNVSLGLWEVPILHAYSQKGFQSATPAEDGSPAFEANPIFENRIYFGPSFNWGNGFVTLWTPFILKDTKYSDYQSDAKFNDDWQHELTFYSELLLQLLPNMGLGLSYESGNLIKADFSDFTLNDGFNKGRAQFILFFNL